MQGCQLALMGRNSDNKFKTSARNLSSYLNDWSAIKLL